MAQIIFYTKLGCSTSAKQVALLEQSGHQVEVRDLLAHTWSAEELTSYFGEMPVDAWFNPNSPRVKSGEIDPGSFDCKDALAAMQAGVDWVEGAFCGLGGDLWLPGDVDVLGNTPTEDLAAMLQYMKIRTGIDLERYGETVKLATRLTGSPAFGNFTRGGSRAEMRDIIWEEILAQPGKEIPTTSE